MIADPEMDWVPREEEEEASPSVANGGAAMVAYGELQRRDLPVDERGRLEGQLKRCCKLDTLAMLMVYEALRECQLSFCPLWLLEVTGSRLRGNGVRIGLGAEGCIIGIQ